MNQLSDRLNSLSPSATLAMSQKSAELKAQGVDVINLSVGEPDFNTPDHIKEAAKKAIDDNFSRYSPVPGYPALRNAIVEKLKKENGLEYTAAQISCANGAKQSVCNAVLVLVNPGDEVIVPSYTFVSTALAFVRQGARIVFADSRMDNPCIDEQKLEALVTPRTRAIVPVHYAGIACDMDVILAVAERHNLLVIEDAAQAIDSFYKGRPLGSIGHLAAFSFHETKNIQCGEGGLLAINDPRFVKRSEILWEKGTNRAEFFRGEINKYGWVDTGSSFLPPEYVAAFLWAQLEALDSIQQKRKEIWNMYYQNLQGISSLSLPVLPDYATNNAHAFYAVCATPEERTALIRYLKSHGVYSVFHYLSLHKSDFVKNQKWEVEELPQADKYTDCLVRFPLFYALEPDEVKYICEQIKSFYTSERDEASFGER